MIRAAALSSSLDDVTRDEARRLVQDELAKAPYQQTFADWLGNRIGDFFSWLDDLLNEIGRVDPAIGTLIFAAVTIAVVLFVLFFVRPRIAARTAAKERKMFDDDTRLSATAHRKSADEAARKGEFSAAVRERVRAIARMAEERELLDVSATLTVSELIRALVRSLDTPESELAWLATSFNAFAYANVQATRADYERVVEVDSHIANAARRTNTTLADSARELVLPQ